MSTTDSSQLSSQDSDTGTQEAPPLLSYAPDPIDKILAAVTAHNLFASEHPAGVFDGASVADRKKMVKATAKSWYLLVHPDKTANDRAADAFDKLFAFTNMLQAALTTEEAWASAATTPIDGKHCTKCKSNSHYMFECLIPLGCEVRTATWTSECRICQTKFLAPLYPDNTPTGEAPPYDTICSLYEMGWVHRTCAERVSEEAKPRPHEERLADAISGGVPESVVTVVEELAEVLAFPRQPELVTVQAAPGSGKTYACVVLCKYLGARDVLVLTYNVKNAAELAVRGAVNAHTFNSIGMWAVTKYVGKRFDAMRTERKRAGFHSAASLTLLENKPQVLLEYLYPYEPALDGGFPYSLVVRLFGATLAELYDSCLSQGFFVPESDRVQPTDMLALLEFAEKKGKAEKLELVYVDLVRSDQNRERIAQLWPTPRARLTFLVSLLPELYAASMQTLIDPVWSPRSRSPALVVDGVRVHENLDTLHFRRGRRTVSVALPICSFAEQVIGIVHLGIPWPLPRWLKAILIDESQDISQGKLDQVEKLRDCSNRWRQQRMTAAPPITPVIAFGDSDQAINATHADALPDAYAALTSTFRRSLELHMSVCLRCAPSLVTYLNQMLGGYAEARAVTRTKPPLVSLPGRDEGGVLFNVVFSGEPGEHVRDVDYSVRNGIFARRNVDLVNLYTHLVRRGYACALAVDAKGECTGLFDAITAVYEAARSRAARGARLSDLEELLQRVQHENHLQEFKHGLTVDHLAGCLRSLIAPEAPDLDAPDLLLDALSPVIAAKFSAERCKNLVLETAHSSKGCTVHTSYILQPNLLPMQRNLNAPDDLTVVQEMNVHYVASSRSQVWLYHLAHAQNMNFGVLFGEDAGASGGE